MHRTFLDFRADFFLGLSVAFLILPLRLTLAWVGAACVHEAAHYLVLLLCKTEVYRIKIGLGGAFMETSPMSCNVELLCALAGPVSGLMLLLLVKWLPTLAVCGCLQSAYNLLPVFPLDGGRVLKCIMKRTNLPSGLYRVIEIIVFTVLVFGALYLTFRLLLGPLPLIGVTILFIKVKFSCKQDVQRVQ